MVTDIEFTELKNRVARLEKIIIYEIRSNSTTTESSKLKADLEK